MGKIKEPRVEGQEDFLIEDHDLNDVHNEAAERAKNFVEQFQMEKKIESVIRSDQQLYDRIERDLDRKMRQLIIQAICLLLRFFF